MKPMMTKDKAIVLALAGLLPIFVSAQAMGQSELIELPGMGGGFATSAGISLDGRVVVGAAWTGDPEIHSFYWTPTGGMIDLGTLGGGYSFPSTVSADGRVVIGRSTTSGNLENHAFRWTQSDGMLDLGTLGGAYSSAENISADGKVIVGGSATLNWWQTHAFRWTQADGLADLGTLGGVNSMAHGVSSDGKVVVGSASTAASTTHAFRWTQAGGMVDLGTLGGISSVARNTSYNGNVVVGESDVSGSGSHAFRWTQAGGMTDLGTLGGPYSTVVGLSRDGAVVVGDSGTANWGMHAFRWTQSGGMVDLGTFGGAVSSAKAVSADDRVVVGWSATDQSLMKAFRWSEATGMLSIEDWLRSAGVSVAGFTFQSADATNADGSVVVGQLGSSVFYARVSEIGSGLITLPEIRESLYAAAHGSGMATSFATTAINGGHGRPLSRLVEAGQRTFWLAGDWGRDDHGSRSGDLGLAEAGLGYNFGPLQVNVSLGQTWAQQRLTLDGRAKVDGTYLLAEALVPVTGKLWAALGAYGHWGDADLRRAYLNGGLPDYSTARPAVRTWGLRARLDWDHALHAGSVGFSPYLDLTYSEARLDAYTETGGGFPARFDARRDRATDLRLGSNATYPLMGDLRLLGTLEAVHRFERSGARASGEVIGMFDFDLAGIRTKQDWLRLGGGVEGSLAGGKATLSINATTQGETPNIWLAANWQVAF